MIVYPDASAFPTRASARHQFLARSEGLLTALFPALESNVTGTWRLTITMSFRQLSSWKSALALTTIETWPTIQTAVRRLRVKSASTSLVQTLATPTRVGCPAFSSSDTQRTVITAWPVILQACPGSVEKQT